MRVGVLTTDTPHHRFFLRELSRCLSSGIEIAITLFEESAYPWRRRARKHFMRSLPNLWRATILNPYLQSRGFAAKQIEWEEAKFFPTGDRSLPSTLRTHVVHSVNNADADRLLIDARPDLLFVYGTGLVEGRIFNKPALGAVNAHGGLLPGYRGLDTNLWAALEGRPNDMAVTLHKVEADYDTGEVYLQRRLGRIPGLDALTLRYHTTRIVVSMAMELLQSVEKGRLVGRTQSGMSRYYGPMPHLLKRRADKIIRAFAAGADQVIPG